MYIQIITRKYLHSYNSFILSSVFYSKVANTLWTLKSNFLNMTMNIFIFSKIYVFIGSKNSVLSS